MNTEVLKNEREVDKHEVVGLMKGTGYLCEFIKYFGIMPWEIKEDYQFAYDNFGLLNLYIKRPNYWSSIWVFTRIRKKEKTVSDHIKYAIRCVWLFR